MTGTGHDFFLIGCHFISRSNLSYPISVSMVLMVSGPTMVFTYWKQFSNVLQGSGKDTGSPTAYIQIAFGSWRARGGNRLQYKEGSNSFTSEGHSLFGEGGLAQAFGERENRGGCGWLGCKAKGNFHRSPSEWWTGVLLPSFTCAGPGLAYSWSCVGVIVQMTSETAWLLSGLLLIFFFFFKKKSIIKDYFKFIKTVSSADPVGFSQLSLCMGFTFMHLTNWIRNCFVSQDFFLVVLPLTVWGSTARQLALTLHWLV